MLAGEAEEHMLHALPHTLEAVLEDVLGPLVLAAHGATLVRGSGSGDVVGGVRGLQVRGLQVLCR
ncbi:hypothetical protein GCM10009849_12200 [Sinomonas flava]|uniref:Uncharacterized protein n=1 Tax=Sinomonas flava TaxID=496857 RepID=A0ABN3BPR4_9MICC